MGKRHYANKLQTGKTAGTPRNDEQVSDSAINSG